MDYEAHSILFYSYHEAYFYLAFRIKNIGVGLLRSLKDSVTFLI